MIIANSIFVFEILISDQGPWLFVNGMYLILPMKLKKQRKISPKVVKYRMILLFDGI